MPRTLAAIVAAQIKKIMKLDEEYYTAVVDLENIHSVYVLIRNLPDDYKGGEYFYKLHIPQEFPYYNQWVHNALYNYWKAWPGLS